MRRQSRSHSIIFMGVKRKAKRNMHLSFLKKLKQVLKLKKVCCAFKTVLLCMPRNASALTGLSWVHAFCLGWLRSRTNMGAWSSLCSHNTPNAYDRIRHLAKCRRLAYELLAQDLRDSGLVISMACGSSDPHFSALLPIYKLFCGDRLCSACWIRSTVQKRIQTWARENKDECACGISGLNADLVMGVWGHVPGS